MNVDRLIRMVTRILMRKGMKEMAKRTGAKPSRHGRNVKQAMKTARRINRL